MRLPAGRWPEGLVGTPFQAEGFVTAWMAAHGATNAGILLLEEDATGVRAALPLEIVRRFGCRVARFPGATHANANGWRTREAALPLPLSAHRLAPALRAAGLAVDALELSRVPDARLFGRGFAIRPAAEARFAVSLAGGIDAVIERGNGRRKRKKFRAQGRHFEARGGYRFLDVPRGERPAALAVFAEQKRLRFHALGMPNPFSDRDIAAFLETLFTRPDTDARLYAIESGGAFKAMLGGIAEGGTFWGMFSSFAEDEDTGASPGELLLWHLAETLSGEGFDTLDLGPGEERYKRSWCDRVIAQEDGMLALTAAGRAYVALARTRRAAVAVVKGEPRLRRIAQRLRRLVKGR